MTRIMIDSEKNSIYEAIDSFAAVLITDTKGRFIYVNKNFCDLTGYKSVELIGKPASIFKSGYHSDSFYSELWMQLLSGKTWRGMFCNKTKSGELIWLDTIIKPILNSENKIEKFVGIRLNATEFMENKSILKSQEEQIRSVSRFATLGEISGYIAHEINNPLTVLNLATNALKSTLKQGNPDLIKINNLSEKIENVVNRMIKITQTLRDHSRKGNSQMDLFYFYEIIDDAKLITEDIARRNDTELLIENKISNDVKFTGHKIQLSQVLINLIKNACDAIQDQEEKRIIVTAEKLEGLFVISVKDSGEISEENASKLFTPYYTTKKVGQGTGIGLSISKQIVEEHGGKIYLDPYSIKTRFVIEIPFK